MRIAFVIDRYRPGKGGLEIWLASLAERLGVREHEVHLLSADARVAGPFRHHPVPGRGLTRAARDRRFAERAAELTGTGAFDAVVGLRHCLHCHLYAPHGGSVAASFTDHRPARVRNFLALERELLTGERPPRRILAVSEMVREDLAERFPSVAERIRVVPNGVDLERFTPGPGSGGRTLLFLAGNPRLKGWPAARRVFEILRAEGLVEELLVAGGDPGGLPAGARYLGHVERPEEVLRSADLLLHPTLYDPFPLVMLEALACGTPVLTTERNGALTHVGRGGPVRAVADPEDVPGLVAGAKELLAEPCREEARRRAEGFPVGESFERTEVLIRASAG